MNNYYELLEIDRNASTQEIKKAFRELAKQLHPDIAGEKGAEEMRKLLAAYQTLLDRNRRFEYDRAYTRFATKYSFDYRTFLRERSDDPGSQAKLLFFELLHFEEDEALSIWWKWGGLEFALEKYLDREDWMDCMYILAEELDKRALYYETFVLLVNIVREEKRRPYFKHFMEEVEAFLHRVVRLHLRHAVEGEAYVECLEAMLGLGFPPRDEARWLRTIAETLLLLGDLSGAERAFREALKRDSSIPGTKQLRKKLKV